MPNNMKQLKAAIAARRAAMGLPPKKGRCCNAAMPGVHTRWCKRFKDAEQGKTANKGRA